MKINKPRRWITFLFPRNENVYIEITRRKSRGHKIMYFLELACNLFLSSNPKILLNAYMSLINSALTLS